jgi:hypothetical protein
VQDELSALFARQMSMENPVPTSDQQRSDLSATSLVRFPSSAAHSIPQHYLPFRAVRHETFDQPSHVEMVDVGEIPSAGEILKRHNIEPSSLSPDQLKLFEHAPQDQRLRLIHMWQIVSQNAEHVMSDSRAPTSMSDHHHETKPDELENGSRSDPSRLQTLRFPDTIDLIAMDDQGRAAGDACDLRDAEPYIISGYEALAQRDYDLSVGQSMAQQDHDPSLSIEPTTGSPYNLATDPIFQARRWWERAKVEPVEHQYGSFEQINQFTGCGLIAGHWLRSRTHF